MASEQLALGAEVGRTDVIEVVVYDRWGRVCDRIPAHLGDRTERREVCSLHEAILWGYVAREQAERIPPTWATMPGHEPEARRVR